MYSPKNEEKWLDFWEEGKIFEKSVKQRSPEKPYIFYDGPPFATGLPHHGHILGLTIKDLYPRYFTMKGYRVERQWGWDCHGLPVETKVEELKGIKNKKQIEEMGVTAFNAACAEQVLEFAHEWGKTVRRMGKWIDFENAYKTMDPSYMESVWWVFKELYDKGHIYEGKKILMYCPRCQTPLAKAEIAMDHSYKNITEPAAYVKFPLKGEENIYLLAWTTTPWTLIGNAALAVNPEMIYVKVQQGKDTLILAQALLKVLTGDYTKMAEFKGKELLGKKYNPLYHLDSEKEGHYVVDGGENVSAEEGTGIVHIASYGEFDYELITKYDLPLFTHVQENGTLHGGHADWHGLWFKKADPLILKELTERGLVYKQEPHSHTYPFCYRCETPLFYRPMDSWFVRIQASKERILARAETIQWHPQEIAKTRYSYIVETMPDWNISRNRYWATAIPVWKCSSCGEMKVIGSIAELEKYAIEPLPKDIDLHKHVVDTIHLLCVCGKNMSRIPEVLDCWFESGAMPYAARHYPFENKENLSTFFPAEFVSEYVAQIRAWFNYMHVLGVLLLDHAPFKHAVVSGNILASDGSKMSKSKKNFTDPFTIFDTYGADALRFYLMQSPVTQAQDIHFKDEGVQEVYRKVILPAANTLDFYRMYAAQKTKLENPHSPHILDKWIIARLHQTLSRVTEGLDGYDTITPCQALSSFISDLSTWYLRRSRERVKGTNDQDKMDAIRTLAYVLHQLSHLLAPITPFLAEEIFQTLKKMHPGMKESVHLEDWPRADEKMIDPIILQNMDACREAVRLALDQRERHKIPIRQPLSKATLYGITLNDAMSSIFKDELHVKEVSFAEAGKDGVRVELDTTLTPTLLAEGAARELMRAIQDLRKKANMQPQEEVEVFLESSPQFQKMISPHSEEVKAKVRARTITYSKATNPLQETNIIIKEEPLTIQLQKRT
ncbi:MAG: isoleucine--tRNA ligase [Candidatus Diapherotrites archaeon]|nr:isoleucine--tRNA ligase [Candidatus Diapherotrites archaeon]MDZ4256085.1 isoleucine--tRNA ligase [archaeon]